MIGIFHALALLTDGVSLGALAFHVLAAATCWRIAPMKRSHAVRLPSICVMRPLCGLEPHFDEALSSVLSQVYAGPVRFVFGSCSGDDLAIARVRRRAVESPQLDIRVVVDERSEGANPKVANLCNMWSEAHGELIVVTDSDTHLPPGALQAVGEALATPGVGAATALYFGRPAQSDSCVQRLGAAYLDGWFAPSAVMHAALAKGVQVGYGPLVGVRREVLEQGGGFPALRDTLADDTELAALARRQGLAIALLDVWPETTVSDPNLRALLAHELRWARTNRRLHPWGYLASVVMHPGPLPWLAALLTPSPAFLGAALILPILRKTMMLALRAKAGRPLGDAPSLINLFLRDQIYFAVWAAGLFGASVEWRGHRLGLRASPSLRPQPHSQPAPSRAEAA